MIMMSLTTQPWQPATSRSLLLISLKLALGHMSGNIACTACADKYVRWKMLLLTICTDMTLQMIQSWSCLQGLTA